MFTHTRTHMVCTETHISPSLFSIVTLNTTDCFQKRTLRETGFISQNTIMWLELEQQRLRT